jgi:predicted dithiol-disulfide oxidoreductase (DUF899 family)
VIVNISVERFVPGGQARAIANLVAETRKGLVMEQHAVVSQHEWVEARKTLLAQEKEFSRMREQLAQTRRDLPWEAVIKEYVFEGPAGQATLSDLFEGRTQLIVYHFMFDPGSEEGCLHCSFWADNFDGTPVHLGARDVTLTAVSRAPFTKIAAYKRRMGWTFPWFSSSQSDFNYDFGASFTPEAVADHAAVFNYGSGEPGFEDREGISVFFKNDADEIFHTYSTYARGIDMVNGAYQFLDLVPKGRDEPKGDTQFWVRRHDEYGA